MYGDVDVNDEVESMGLERHTSSHLFDSVTW
jgi:hypothetical protein